MGMSTEADVTSWTDSNVPEWDRRERVLLARYATFSSESLGRVHPESTHPYRGPFQRDRDRILHSAAFRRLSGKMQVFTEDMGDYHRTRLTHTQEVASIARTIGRTLKLNEDLIEALALLHDVGHPPFGHSGEEVLNHCLETDGGFSHNRFALELVQNLEQRYTPYPGLNLTYEVLSGQKFRVEKNANTVPSLEVQVVDAADSIAYNSHDVDDALQLKLLEWEELEDLQLIERSLRHRLSARFSEHSRRQMLVHALIDLQVDDFLEQSMLRLAEVRELDAQAVREVGIRLRLSDTIESEKTQLEDFLFERVYRHPKIITMRERATSRLTQLFRVLAEQPQKLPLRFQTIAAKCGIAPAVGQYLAGLTDHACEEQFTKLVELGNSQAQDWT